MLLPLCHNSFPPFKPLRPNSPLPQYLSLPKPKNHPQILPPPHLRRRFFPHQSPIKRIADKLRSLGYTEEDPKETLKENTDDVSAGEIFIPLPKHLRKYRVGHTIDTSWSSPENPVPEPGLGKAIQRFHGLRRRVMKEKKEEKEKRKAGQGREAAAPTVAELTLPAEELRRLRALGIELRKKIKAGKAGITEGIVNGIHERWTRAEVVKIVCEDICRLNMQRTHDLLERKTGGLIIWRSGGNIILYRGANYKYPYFLYDNNSTNYTSAGASPSSSMDSRVHFRDERCPSGEESTNSVGPHSSNKMGQLPLIQGVGSPNKVRFQLPGEAQLAEEAGSQLDGLGPRFTDWWGYDPLPVDADLLPAIVPGYRKPFRLLPYGVKPKLTNDEMTILKRLGRPLPCHFVLGRNRKLQGLAAAMLKLWEKCEIAKIAVKRGVQNTRSELMAEELKLLTGGILLSRDKEIIVFYRGKDFLPAAVSSAIEERRKCAIPREKHSTDCSSSVMARQKCEVRMVDSRRGDKSYGIKDEKRYLVSKQRKLRFAEAAVKKTSMKLQMALEKKAGAERLLAELDRKEIPQDAEVDKEGITEEERYMLRKCGLRMKPFLLLGRRGVFDGTVENMHLHWKYRELVKVICGGRSIEEARGIAESLEAESGGILVAVERVNKGYAIIVYRGKNYKRPSRLRPQTLLNKRQAMMRSLEAQRRESLKLHVLKLSRNIEELKLQLAKDQETNKLSTKKLNSQLVEEEADKRCLREYKSSDANVLPNYCSSSVIPSGSEENVEGRERSGADSSSLTSYDGIDAPMGSPETSQQGMLRGFSLVSEDKEDGFKITEPEQVSESVLKYSGVLVSMEGQDGDVESVITPADPMAMIPSVESPKSGTVLSACDAVKNLSMKVPFRAARISNRRDRLLLRKQALKMRYHHVLAVDSSNIATGVAKSIQTHFKKHPFAIVNVKGRPKGTSVHAVVLELEQATGGVLVSQEPSKVILYRGWGARKEPGQCLEINTKDVWKRPSASTEGEAARPVVSPELVSAIRFGSGLQRETEVGEEISL